MADHRARAAFAQDLRSEISSDPVAVREFLSLIHADLSAQGISDDAVTTAEIVLAEILNNIVEHAYRDDSTGRIVVAMSVARSAICFQISDNGVALPGHKLPAARRFDLSCAVEDLPEGGFGWAMIRDMTSNLRYRRVGNRNELQFDIVLGADA